MGDREIEFFERRDEWTVRCGVDGAVDRALLTEFCWCDDLLGRPTRMKTTDRRVDRDGFQSVDVQVEFD
jgi:hypothetical protein